MTNNNVTQLSQFKAMHYVAMGVLMTCLIIPQLLNGQNLFDAPVILDQGKGLPSNYVNKILEDELGFAWIGTPAGLVRFDGSNLELFQYDDEDSTSIAGNFIHGIASDVKNDKIWVAHDKGLSYFDINKKEFYNFEHNPNDPNSIPVKSTSAILKDRQGNIWIAFREGGLRKYIPQTNNFKRFDQCESIPSKFGSMVCHRGIYAIEEDVTNDSILWLGASGLNRFNKYTGVYENYTIELANKKDEPQSNVPITIFAHPDGKIYYGTFFHGVFVFDPIDKQIRALEPCYLNGVQGFDWGKRVQTIYPKSKQELWISSTNGLQLYNVESNCISATYPNEDERTYTVDHIDKYHRIWSATKNHGFQIFNPVLQQVEHIYFEEKTSKYPSYAVKIIEDTIKQKLFVASHSAKGLFIYDQRKKTWDLIPIASEYLARKGGTFITDIIRMEDGSVLLLEDQALYYYQEGFSQLQLYPFQLSNPNGKFRHVIKDREGDYWMTCGVERLVRFDPKEHRFTSFKEEINALAPDSKLTGDDLVEDQNGNIWIQERSGLIIYEKASGKFHYHPHKNQDLEKVLWLGPIEKDQNGGLWMATKTKYLAYAHADSLHKGIIRLYGKADGLEGTHVAAVRCIKDKIMVFTNRGIQFFNPLQKKFTTGFVANYGFPKPYNQPTELSTGHLVMGFSKYISIFHPDSLKHNPELPKAYISSFDVFDEQRQLRQDPTIRDSVYLSYKDNFFSFGFSAIGYNLPQQIKFRYQLEGFDKKWQDGTERQFKSYTNVPGGDYVFKVEAMNSEGRSLGAPTEVYIHISTVWYKTVWFWTLMILGLTSIGYAFYQWRIQQVRSEERLKSDYEQRLINMEMSALRAQMNPHFVFNALNSIEYFIISNNPRKASDYLNRFSRLIRLVLQNSKSSKVPLQDDLEALKLYIEIESMRFNNLFSYVVEVEEGLDTSYVQVPPLLLQPFVENSIWHGLMHKKEGEGKIALKLHSEQENLICIIEDNGIGRAAAEKLKSRSGGRKKSFGMKITADRLEALNHKAQTNASEVHIIDLKDESGNAAGTRVRLVIPF